MPQSQKSPPLFSPGQEAFAYTKDGGIMVPNVIILALLHLQIFWAANTLTNIHVIRGSAKTDYTPLFNSSEFQINVAHGRRECVEGENKLLAFSD